MYHNSRSYDVWFLRYKVQRTKFFVILGYYCHLTLLRTQKSQFWKNNKNAWRYYHFTLMYHKWWSNDAWFLRHQVRQTNCFHFRLFFLLLTPNSPRNIKFKKMKKAPGDNIILHKCTKYHMICYAVLKIWHMTDVIVQTVPWDACDCTCTRRHTCK